MKCSPASHARLRRPSVWPTLPLVGVQRIEADESGPAEEIELRNCDQGCGSTLAVELTPQWLDVLRGGGLL